MKKAIVILNGGIHSTTALAVAKSREFELYALSFDYGQKNRVKLDAASKIAKEYGVKEHRIIKIDIAQILPEDLKESPYVPARNNLYLSFALSWAEVIKASDMFLGINSIEYGDNPDCRPAFVHTFEKLANVALKKEGKIRKLNVWSPCMNSSTSENILRGKKLGVDYSMTYPSCDEMSDDGTSCGECFFCENRKGGFEDADLPDPTKYKK
jgi:7-cyano-7-deazaguanine synthase